MSIERPSLTSSSAQNFNRSEEESHVDDLDKKRGPLCTADWPHSNVIYWINSEHKLVVPATLNEMYVPLLFVPLGTL